MTSWTRLPVMRAALAGVRGRFIDIGDILAALFGVKCSQ